ncbi:PHP domain-like protein [Cryphonectria parasitica EP155]|uniref:PHP domain-like protein n=1 Tax=Cryphonectria parasitica (strain ATCC 38755 / EP155) TaxID=660469 RepID=A0A9P4Y113_CRYP1|nr:PHP domain-like protein [Cryphonectria parasitica EP155]KAF3764534.1 PHP domain-like protein [Cryphonectria parasitica EP155]
MLYDLNIVWTPQTTQAGLERTLRFSHSLGYNVVALNHILEPPIPAQVTNPIPQIGPVHSSFPQLPPIAASTNDPSSAPPTTTSSTKPLPTVLRRATLLVSDPAANHRLPLLVQTYSLLAARPLTERAFAALTTGTSFSEVSLISLDLSVSQPFRFRPKPCMAAVNRGVLFEVCYGQLLLAGGTGGDAPSARARATFIANVLELVRATKGRGIVLSSECRAAGGGGALRAPADVVNLLACWGLGPERGLEGLGVNPRSVVVNEGLKRRSFRGVVDIVSAEGRVPGARPRAEKSNGDGDGEEGSNNKKTAKKKKGGGEQQQNTQQQQQQGKRKHDGGSDAGVAGDQALPVMSKRQAKKMKLAGKKESATAPEGSV